MLTTFDGGTRTSASSIDGSVTAPRSVWQSCFDASVTIARELGQFDPVSLDDLDRRAALQRRVDQTYVVDLDQLRLLLNDLRTDHEALEIDGERGFDYRSSYFDTPELTCFREHVRDHKPRYKVRTRHYVTTRGCVFEVKVKREDGDTDKHSIDYDGNSEAEVTGDAWSMIERTLGEAGIEVPERLACTLVTEFERCTLGVRGGAERTTIDQGLRLSCSEGRSLVMDRGLTLVETKTEDGNGRCDRALAEAGIEPISFSKYRLGVGRLIAPSEDPGYAARLLPSFSTMEASSS